MPALREAAENVFTARGTHDFPPAIFLPVEWRPELAALAREMGYPATSAAESEARFGAFVARLDGEETAVQ